MNAKNCQEALVDTTLLPIFFGQSLLHPPKFNLAKESHRVSTSKMLIYGKHPLHHLMNAIPHPLLLLLLLHNHKGGVQMNIRTLTPIKVDEEESYPSNKLSTPSTTENWRHAQAAGRENRF